MRERRSFKWFLRKDGQVDLTEQKAANADTPGCYRRRDVEGFTPLELTQEHGCDGAEIYRLPEPEADTTSGMQQKAKTYGWKPKGNFNARRYP